jgi:hypothetical protein
MAEPALEDGVRAAGKLAERDGSVGGRACDPERRGQDDEERASRDPIKGEKR